MSVFDFKHQDLLDQLASTARLTADSCQRAANLHLSGQPKDGPHYAKLREEIAANLNRLHDLLDQNSDGRDAA